MNKKRKITAGILFCLIFVLCAGIRGFLLADGQIPLSDDASLYEASMIREEKNEPVMTSGVVFAYTEILTDVLKFTGNKLEAVAVMQLLLQCATVVLLYFGCFALSGRTAALLEALFFSVFPFFWQLMFAARPENIYLAGFGFLLLLTGLCRQKINKGGFHRRSMDEFLIFLTGFVSGVLLIWHLMTVFLIVVFLAVAAFHAAQLLERRKDSKNRIFLIYPCGILLGCFGTLMKYTGITGNTLIEQFSWWISSFTAVQFQGLSPFFVFLLPGSVLGTAGIQLLMDRIAEGKGSSLSVDEAVEEVEMALTEEPESRGEMETVEEKKEKKKVNYIENPLPLPKKHVKRNFDFKLDKRKDDFDIDIEEGDDFDI
ncbi:hypothetical protein DXB46_00360 [Lachnospiraceae bacterium OM04-12BH]|nr:hypothetical protein DXB46_00360 [Lachnospiraceae bacterium OM04-12BH]